MARVLTEKECGLAIGTEVTFTKAALKIENQSESKISISLVGDQNAPICLKFDRATHNHWDELYGYCFKLPSNEELWIEFSDLLPIETRLEMLRAVLRW